MTETMEVSRRGLLGLLVGGIAGGTVVPSATQFLDSFAPLSGQAWDGAVGSAPEHVESPYGEATVAFDDYGVPTVEASTDEALYFAVGFVQARDRLAQMDLQRRLAGGRLAEVVGEGGLDSDRFHLTIGFRRAAEASYRELVGTPTAEALEAFAAGVTTFIREGPLPIEFGLLGYSPDPWTPVDTLLIEKLISWELSGSMPELKHAEAAAVLGVDRADELLPPRMDHEAQILREVSQPSRSPSASQPAPPDRDVAAAGRWLRQFESHPRFGSNSWVVAGTHTASGEPLLAADSHISLMTPPIWYEMIHRTTDTTTHGALIPGSPFIVMGRNDHCAWGITNTKADVLDLYSYETSGDRYRYRDEWRRYEETIETIPVDDGAAETLRVRRTVHGPVIERSGASFAVAWVGMAATRTTEALYRMNRATDLDAFVEALRGFDAPSLNVVYADTAGRTLYQAVGRVPFRTIDGRRVAGDRVFDGSAAHGEWEGFTPYAAPSWTGFIPFEEMPRVVDPGYVATANQRIADDYPHYLSHDYVDPYRAARIYDLLDAAVAEETSVDAALMEAIQLDTVDGRVAHLQPVLLEARDDASPELRRVIDDLLVWDGRMTSDSPEALIFEFWFRRYREEIFGPIFEAAGGDRPIFPKDWVVCTLPRGSVWFTDRPDGRTRPGLALAGLERAVSELEESGLSAYGDYAHTGQVDHQFGLAFLEYPTVPSAGGQQSVRYFEVGAPAGSGWREIYDLADDSTAFAVLPGGNSGDYYSDHYADQIEPWAAGRYRSVDLRAQGDPTIRFGGGP